MGGFFLSFPKKANQRKEQMKRISFFIYLVLILNCNISIAQSYKSDKNIGETFLSDFNHFFDVGIGLLNSPLSFSQGERLATVGITGATALLFTVDKNIKSFALSNQTQLNDNIFAIDEFYGSGYTPLLTATIYGYGLFTRNREIRKLGLHASEALIYSVAITTALKILIGRRRPYAGESQLFLKPFQISNNDLQSLPSGHTTAVFAVSTVMAKYSDNIYWKIFWYGSATLVGFSRIYHNKHWTSDVFLGAGIGYSVGEFISNFDKKSTEYFGVKLNPYFTFNKIGFILKF